MTGRPSGNALRIGKCSKSCSCQPASMHKKTAGKYDPRSLFIFFAILMRTSGHASSITGR